MNNIPKRKYEGGYKTCTLCGAERPSLIMYDVENGVICDSCESFIVRGNHRGADKDFYGTLGAKRAIETVWNILKKIDASLLMDGYARNTILAVERKMVEVFGQPTDGSDNISRQGEHQMNNGDILNMTIGEVIKLHNSRVESKKILVKLLDDVVSLLLEQWPEVPREKKCQTIKSINDRIVEAIALLG